MTPSLDVDHCAACPVVNQCDAWTREGSWQHAKGVRPCRPTILYETPRRLLVITEEPVPIKENDDDFREWQRINRRLYPVIDADKAQEIAIQTRYSMRREK